MIVISKRNTIRDHLERYVFYTHTTESDERAFQRHIRRNTVRLVTPLLSLLVGVVVVFWPTDFILFDDPRILWTYVMWRGTVVGGTGLLLAGLHYSSSLRRYVNSAIVISCCLMALGISYAFGRISEPSAPWFWAILVLPWLTIFLGLRPIPRFLSTIMIVLSYGTGYILPFAENLQYAYLPTTLVLLSGMVILVPIAGHVLYHFMRKDFFQQQELEDKKQQLQKMARYDQLTGLCNRRWFEEQLQQEFERAHRYDRDMSLLMIDLDHFKHVNDTFGHDAGDRVLEEVGTILSEETRDPDVPGRYGGEEFAVFLPETDPTEAHKTAERIRSTLADQTFRSEDEQEFQVTCSIGIAGRREDMNEFTDLVKSADNCLYEAKDSGRNRIVLLHEDSDGSEPNSGP